MHQATSWAKKQLTYWNDTKFIPTSEVLPDLRSYFEKDEFLSDKLISNLSHTSLQKCEEKINLMILTETASSQIGRKSDQGDGGVSWGKEVLTENSNFRFFSIVQIAHFIFGVVVIVPPITFSFFWHMLKTYDLIETEM